MYMFTFSKKTINKLFSQYSRGEGGGRSDISRGEQHFPGVGVQLLIPICIPGGGSGPPAPFVSAHDIVNCIRPHMVLAVRRSMALNP